MEIKNNIENKSNSNLKLDEDEKNIEFKGLTSKEVELRIKEGKVNFDTSVPTKSIKQIVLGNIFTLFNLINFALAILIFFAKSYKNLLFLGVVFSNTLISIIQEIRSKKAIDKLSVLASAKANCIRDGILKQISINEIVIDDLLQFEIGSQVVTDSIILDGEVEVNESFITGESDALVKKKGDTLLSGSFIVSGKAKAKVIHIGDENFTSKISSGAKYVKKVNSEIMKSLNKIIQVISIALVPIGLLLFNNQMHLGENTVETAIVNTVAAMIGMIPEGLILLTSTVLAVSVVRLAKQNVLVQQLYCIETLARVDILCLDKTGTITEGTMEVKDIISFAKSKENLEKILSEISFASEDSNSTIDAIKEKFNISHAWQADTKIAFSSQKKWSGIYFKDEGSFVIGAPEFILKEDYEKYKEKIEKYSKDFRVILLAHSKNNFNEKELPENLEVLGLVLISDKIRKEAKKTLEYFKEQGVVIKIISGDNPITVSKIAGEVGVENFDKYIDMSKIKNEEEIKDIACKYTIFGRVSPVQKKDLVKALKEKGHTVAMTGDGVNDVLSLKEADCSIAMASGSDATKNCSELVLLDSNFASMPKIVAEGRRTINNIERSATLFLVKTIYAFILALIFLVAKMPYPFMPIQLSLISMVTIGIPSFILALEPNKEIIKGHFMKNVISKAIPTAVTVVINIIIIAIVSFKMNIDTKVYSSLCVILTAFSGMLLLSSLCKPLDIFRIKNNNTGKTYASQGIRTALFYSMILIFVFEITMLNNLFSIVIPQDLYYLTAIFMAIACIFYYLLSFISRKIFKVGI